MGKKKMKQGKSADKLRKNSNWPINKQVLVLPVIHKMPIKK
jgi:hypothetical protein